VNFASYRAMLILIGLTVLASLALASLGKAATAGAPQFLIKDFMFSPMSVTVKAGETVTWANKDDEPHTVVSDNGLFRSAALDTDETFSFKFDKPGTYHFACSIHPRMVGTIVVE
jgi:plastocyanin